MMKKGKKISKFDNKKLQHLKNPKILNKISQGLINKKPSKLKLDNKPKIARIKLSN